MAWTSLGALAGLGLGLLVSVVLVHVVNPQGNTDLFAGFANRV
jgi:hypothetical protein